MRKKGFLAGVVLLLVLLLTVGCGVPKEDYEAVVAERDSAQTELQSVKSELDGVESQLDVVKTELATVKAELQSTQSELSAAQSTMQAQEQEIAKAKTFAELISMVFVPALAGEEVNEVELLFQWRDKVEAAGDAELQRLFDAVMDSEGGDPEILAFFLYLFENLPKALE